MNIKKVLAHICIIFALAFLTLLIIDQVNAAMGFITSQITKIWMIIGNVLVVITCTMVIAGKR